jgi:formate dehydrogenase major subunit
MSRYLPWLAELQPEMFVEIDPALARDRGIEDRGWMTVITARGEIEARAMVTPRIKPLNIGGRVVHQISIPWHWSWHAPSPEGATGDAANELGVLSGDPNVSIQESKAYTCDVRAGRRSGEPSERLAGVHGGTRVAANEDHPAERPTHLAQTSQSSGAKKDTSQ